MPRIPDDLLIKVCAGIVLLGVATSLIGVVLSMSLGEGMVVGLAAYGAWWARGKREERERERARRPAKAPPKLRRVK